MIGIFAVETVQRQTVYSSLRKLKLSQLNMPLQLVPSALTQMEGKHFLSLLPEESIPAAGSYSVMQAAQASGRNYIGCDILA